MKKLFYFVGFSNVIDYIMVFCINYECKKYCVNVIIWWVIGMGLFVYKNKKCIYYFMFKLNMKLMEE